ncbi:hypothetical protein NC652_000176 [Populus alba x Populus x berolinensis]|nr:hypothetical protein NC652_000176 [Populus alba x Populus x berolinensis]
MACCDLPNHQPEFDIMLLVRKSSCRTLWRCSSF